MPFQDRREAGRRLAAALAHLATEDPVVLALPRGGVPVAFKVAKALGAPLDLVMVRKIGAPFDPEYGIGAVVDGADPHLVLDETVLPLIQDAQAYVEWETKRQLAEIERRRALYRGGRPPIPVSGRTVIVVDDGVATGGTARAALVALRKARAMRLILAVPVGPRDVLGTLRREADEVVCLEAPEPFHAVGFHYRDFEQTTDEEVVRLLAQAAGP